MCIVTLLSFSVRNLFEHHLCIVFMIVILLFLRLFSELGLQLCNFCLVLGIYLSNGILNLFVDALLDAHKSVFFYFFDLLVVCHNFYHSFGCPIFDRVEQSLEVFFAIDSQHIWRVFCLELADREDGRDVSSFGIFIFFEGFCLVRHELESR